MNKNKYRFWCNAAKDFITNYNYNGAVDELFDDPLLTPQQFLGILDKNMKEVYEGDVVQFKTDFKSDIGVVRYMNDWCSYVVEVEEGYDLFAVIHFDSLEVIGNMDKDYIWDETGSKLIKRVEYR